VIRADPTDLLRWLYGRDVEIDDHRLLAAANQDAVEGFIGVRVDFLVRDEGRHVDEIAGLGFGNKFERISQRIRARPRTT
jgi:hypothetical protein